MEVSIMMDAAFKFNFKFKLHKTSISIGLGDEDYERLSVAYGVTLADVMAEVTSAKASNMREAGLLLKKYPDASEMLRGKRIAFLGDSITSDWQSYMNVMRAAFEKDKDIEILDAAVSGFKTIDLMTNFVPLVTDFKPDIVHIMIGTNDMKRTTDAAAAILIPPEEYRRELCYLVDRLKNDGARIVLSTLPPFDPDKIYASFNAVNVQYVEADRTAYNGVVREVAAEYDCILNEMEDVYKKHESAQITEADGLHLNLDGQRMLACGVLESLMDAAGSI